MSDSLIRRRLVQAYLPVIHLSVDALIWAVSVPLTTLLRFDFDLDRLVRKGIPSAVLVAVVCQIGFGYATGLYRRRWRYGTFDEIRVLGATVIATGLALTVTYWVADSIQLPRSVPPLATAITLSGTVALRSMWRLWKERLSRPSSGEPVVVLGAGSAAAQMVQSLRTDPDSPYMPVAMLDDDPHRRNLTVAGVRVVGTLADLTRTVRDTKATAVLLAIPSAPPVLKRQVALEVADLGLPLLVLPPPEQLFGSVTSRDLHPVRQEDLLGRDTAEIDPAAVAQYITGKRVLVTGAGGSIGSELCRQLHRFNPEKVYMLDRDESGLHGVQLSIDGKGMLDDHGLVLADIRDAARLDEVFTMVRPHVVFHAAALKHLTLLQAAPDEAWKTNVVGTNNVLEAALAHGVERVVNISTDKAANPTSVLGYSKRLTEFLTSHAATRTTGAYVSVRFGNVLGSRGSVLTAFAAQAAAGGPLSVTHPDVTRYFMTVEEAVRLTIYAGAIGRSGEVLVLDMGEPVRIADVAKRFAEQQEPPLRIQYTGLRPGEKLHEELLATDETDHRPVHPLITHVPVTPVPLAHAPDVLTAWGLHWPIEPPTPPTTQWSLQP